MPRPASARFGPRSLVWLLSLACTYVLVGTWALTPELARHSLAREVSVTAVPPKPQRAPRPTAARDDRARDADAPAMERWRIPDAHAAPAPVHPAAVAAPAVYSAPPDDARRPARPGNRPSHEAIPPPGAQ